MHRKQLNDSNEKREKKNRDSADEYECMRGVSEVK